MSRKKQTYRVTGTTGYRGHKQGEEVKLDLTEDERRRAIERGALEPVDADKNEKEGSNA